MLWPSFLPLLTARYLISEISRHGSWGTHHQSYGRDVDDGRGCVQLFPVEGAEERVYLQILVVTRP